MTLSPIAFVTFLVLFCAAAAIVAAVNYHLHEHARHAAHARTVASVLIGGAVAWFALAHWNDATAATSLLHQRLYVAGIMLSVVTLVVTAAARSLERASLRTPLALINMFAAGGLIGLVVGTTDWGQFDVSGDYVNRLILACMLIAFGHMFPVSNILQRRSAEGDGAGELLAGTGSSRR